MCIRDRQSREEALEKALDTMARAVKACDEAGYGDCILCPETMGKVNQLGTLDEVLALCGVDERITPCIDFGHLYARSLGTQFAEGTAAVDYAALLDTLQAGLGDERAKQFHAHFSRIAYTKGGEKCHLTFADTEYGLSLIHIYGKTIGSEIRFIGVPKTIDNDLLP